MNLKRYRKRLGFTQQDLAKELNTTQQTIARWENGKTAVNADQIRDLCLVLHCSAEELLGVRNADHARTSSRLPRLKDEFPYGTLRLELVHETREYPISLEARESIINQMANLDSLRGDNHERAWVYSWSLDNKIIWINPRYLRELTAISDDVEEMPKYEHPVVYQAIENWEIERPSGKLLEACEKYFEAVGGYEIATRTASCLRVTFDSGRDAWCYLSEISAAHLFGLDLGILTVSPTSFVQVEEDGSGLTRYINLDNVVMLEVPQNCYLGLIDND